MSNPSAPNGNGWPAPGRRDDDAWGPSTAVRSGSARPIGRAFTEPSGQRRPPSPGSADGWSPAGPASRDQQRAGRIAERNGGQQRDRPLRRARERGLPWWAALAVLVVIAVLGGIIDTVGSFQVRGGFNIGIVVASIVAMLIVKRSHMFPIVIAPPIVYSLAAVFQLYLRSSGLHDKRVVFDAAANYLVYGFPAIAVATAAVLIIAGVRLMSRR